MDRPTTCLRRFRSHGHRVSSNTAHRRSHPQSPSPTSSGHVLPSRCHIRTRQRLHVSIRRRRGLSMAEVRTARYSNRGRTNQLSTTRQLHQQRPPRLCRHRPDNSHHQDGNESTDNTRYHFGGGFIGDYTDLTVDSNNNFRAIWTDTNNVQTVVWWYGFQFVPTSVHQQDVVTATGSF